MIQLFAYRLFYFLTGDSTILGEMDVEAPGACVVDVGARNNLLICRMTGYQNESDFSCIFDDSDLLHVKIHMRWKTSGKKKIVWIVRT